MGGLAEYWELKKRGNRRVDCCTCCVGECDEAMKSMRNEFHSRKNPAPIAIGTIEAQQDSERARPAKYLEPL